MSKNISDPSVEELTQVLKKLTQLRIVRLYEHPSRLLLHGFLQGLVGGLGNILGATVLLAILIYFFSRISWVPILGDIINTLLVNLEASRF